MVFFDSTAVSVLYFAGIVLGSLVLADLIIVLFDKLIRPLVLHTKTTLDDFLFDAVRGPFKLTAFLAGLFLAFKYSSMTLGLFGKTLDELFFLALLFAVAYTLAKVIDALFFWHATESEQKRISKDVFPLARKVLKLVVYLLAVLIILSEFGVEIGPLLAGLGIAGLAVALALQDTLSNFFGGVSILSDKPFKVGDYIALDNESSEIQGTVVEVGWRTTRIKTPRNSIVVISNADLAKRVIHNLSYPGKTNRIVTIDFSVPYDADVEKVRASVKAAFDPMKKNPSVDDSFQPVLRLAGFGNSALDFKFSFQTKTFDDSFPAASQFREALLERFRKDGVEFALPVRSLYVREKLFLKKKAETRVKRG